MKRKDARKQAFEVIFECGFHKEPVEEIIENAEASRDYIHDEFSRGLIDGVFANLSEIDEKIREKSIAWKFERISRVALSLMRLACFEIFYLEDVPVSVSVNEAVELAKEFGSEDDPAFINGILGAVVRKYLPDEAGNLPELKPEDSTEALAEIIAENPSEHDAEDTEAAAGKAPEDTENS